MLENAIFFSKLRYIKIRNSIQQLVESLSMQHDRPMVGQLANMLHHMNGHDEATQISIDISPVIKQM